MDLNRILVTGATGFVGTCVCARLVEEGLCVTAAVRTNDATTVVGVKKVPVGPIESANWEPIVRGQQGIVHLAARVHDVDEHLPLLAQRYSSVNLDGTIALARAAAASGVRRFVFVSTIKVCGEATVDRPFGFDCEPNPIGAYARSKWEAEKALRAIASETGLEVAIVRPPLVYGPGVGANFLRLLLLVDSGLPLPLGSIRNRRSLVYVGNLADIILRCLSHPDAANRTFMVGDGVDLSTPELIAAIGKALGVGSRLWPCKPSWLRAGAALAGKGAALNRLIESLQLDLTSTRTVLNWTPPFSQEQGFAETAAWFRALSRTGQP